MGFACVSLSLRSLLWTANMVGEGMCVSQLFRLVGSVQGVVNQLSINNMSWEIRWLIPFVLLSATHRIWGAKTLTITSTVICHCCILHDLKVHCMPINNREPSSFGRGKASTLRFVECEGKNGNVWIFVCAKSTWRQRVLLQGINDEPFMGICSSSWLGCSVLVAFVVIAVMALKLAWGCITSSFWLDLKWLQFS